MPEPIPFDLKPAAAIRKIRDLAADTKNIVVIDHGKKRQRQRSVTRRQIELCVQKGTIVEGPFMNQHGNWQVSLFRHAAGEELTCVVAIDWPSKLLVVTTF